MTVEKSKQIWGIEFSLAQLWDHIRGDWDFTHLSIPWNYKVFRFWADF